MGKPVAKLIEEGVAAYVSGRIPEALGLFLRVLELDPKNDKARTYLDLAKSTHPGTVPVAPPPDEPPAAPAASPEPPAAAAAPPAAQPGVQSGAAPRAPVAHTVVPYASVPSPAVPEDQRVFELPRSRPPPPAAPPPAPAPASAPPAPAPPAPSIEEPTRPSRPRMDLAKLLQPYFAADLETTPVAPLEPSAFENLIPAPASAAPEPSVFDAGPVSPVAVRDQEPPVRGGAPVPRHAPEPAPVDYAPSPWDDGPTTGATIVLPDEANEGLDLAAVAEKSDLRPLVPQGNAQVPTPHGPPTDVDLWLRAAKELFALGDFTGSLELIEKILTVDPDHGEARDYLRQNEATLVSMYESKLGPLHAIPRLAIKPEEVMWLNLDHRAGFLLAQIDGTVDYEGLFAVSGLPRLDTARILANLIADGVVRS